MIELRICNFVTSGDLNDYLRDLEVSGVLIERIVNVTEDIGAVSGLLRTAYIEVRL